MTYLGKLIMYNSIRKLVDLLMIADGTRRGSTVCGMKEGNACLMGVVVVVIK